MKINPNYIYDKYEFIYPNYNLIKDFNDIDNNGKFIQLMVLSKNMTQMLRKKF